MSSIPPNAQAPVLRLGRYRLLLELGQGGMARVFVAFSSGLGGFNKLVVLKVMRDELRENQSSLDMFLAEARLAARMNHQNIVQTLEVGEDSGRYFICMEYLEGQTLGRLLKKTLDSPLPLAARLELICQVLEALIYMHGFTDPDGTPLSLVHRDISPNNIFVTFDGTAKVLDFGVAKATGVSHATEAGMFKGKLGYAAPEQILGNSEQRSDVFAVGVLLWELLAYRRLSQDRTQQEIVQARMAGVDPELMKKALGVPVELLQICTRAAAKRVEDRYASASDMRDALRAYIRANNLEFSAEQMRAVLDDLYASERVEIRRLVDQRMKQANLEDDHPSFGGQPIPVAPAVLGGIGGATLTGNASTYVLPSAPTNRSKWVAALVGVAVLAGVAGRWLSGSEQQPQPTEAALPTPATQVANGGPRNVATQAKLVTLKIAASPPDTEILLDGAKLEGNPFVGQFTKDASLRRLELRCVGRLTEARMIRLDQDLDLLISLPADKANPLRARAAPAVGVLAKPAALRPTEAVAPAPAVAGAPLPPPLTRRESPAPARPIDDSDPYAK
ncbi:MAG TPA: serine/threonine-protein kinase [Polyangiaceae bacterium]|nr:serine/threonine-protein kinase [Polyangiaceae bacterium]